MKLYLASYEYDDFADPREVVQFDHAMLDDRGVLIVEVDKPLIGQKYGHGATDIRRFFLVSRVDREALDRMERFPIDVFVLIPHDQKNSTPQTLSELDNIAWASLYDNEADARSHKVG